MNNSTKVCWRMIWHIKIPVVYLLSPTKDFFKTNTKLNFSVRTLYTY